MIHGEYMIVSAYVNIQRIVYFHSKLITWCDKVTTPPTPLHGLRLLSVAVENIT